MSTYHSKFYFKIFVQCIIKYNQYGQTLWVNCMKTNEDWFHKYVDNGNFMFMWWGNIEVMLDSWRDREQRNTIKYLINSEFKVFGYLNLKASNNLVDNEIRLHLNANNLYLFYQIFPKISGNILVLDNFEFYSNPEHDPK